MMFKILVLQALHSLSDEGCAFQIKNRLSFQRFLGLGLDGRVPDATTIWLFREKRVKARVKEGGDPKAFKPVDLAIPMFGDKNHIGIDRAHGLIRTFDASAANAHDGARLPELISKQNSGSGVWADTAYRSRKNEAFLERGMFKSNIHQKRMPRRPMPEHMARANAKRSAVRSAIEHMFAGQKHRMGLFLRTIGIARARIKIGMANLAYTVQRLAWLEGRAAPA
jgi:IS5 family transposase